jgi:hypothetical protein
MSWLHSVLHSLNSNELSLIKDMRLIGKEKEVLAYFIENSNAENIDQIAFNKKFNLSETHFYKINSILLDKLFNLFATQGNYALLLWLRQKELYALLKNEYNSQQKKNGHNTEYYLNAFRLLIDLPYKFFDEKLTASCGEAYLKSLNPCTDADRQYVKFHLLFANCNRFAAGKNPLIQFGYTEGDLLLMKKELEATDFHLALYYLYRTICNYYNYYLRNPSKSLQFLNAAIQLKDKISGFFPINIHQFLRLLYADALLNFKEIKESYKLYEEIFKEGLDKDMYGFYYHIEQFATTAILLKKYDKANDLLQEYFDECIQHKNDIYATRGALAYSKLFLSKGEYKKALNYLNLGIEINEKSFYQPFEIQLRVLENICFFLMEEYNFAKQLAVRNTKFISKQKAQELTKPYKIIFKLIAAFTVCIEQNKNLSATLTLEYQSVAENYRKVYCDLIPLMYSKIIKSRRI